LNNSKLLEFLIINQWKWKKS